MFSLDWWFLNFRRKTKKIAATSYLIWRNKVSQYPAIVTKFEARFAKMFGVKHAITVNNGTSGLEAAFFALGLGEGDEIIAPSYTIQATFSAALVQGIGVQFADIDPDTLTVDPASVANLINKRTKAIVVVHVWGNSVNMDGIMELANRHNLKVIEDCSHCHGGSYKDEFLGSIGDIGVFSLQGGKPVAAGEGGIVVTSDDELADKILAYGHQGRRICGTMKTKTDSDFLPMTGYGRKCRAHPLAIAMANVDLGLLSSHNSLHESGRAALEKSLQDSTVLQLQKIQDGGKMAGFFMGAAVKVVSQNMSANHVYDILKKSKVKCDRRNHQPYHQLPHLYDLDYRKDHLAAQEANQIAYPELPNTEYALSHVIFLPLKQFSGLKGQRRWKKALNQLERENAVQNSSEATHG